MQFAEDRGPEDGPRIAAIHGEKVKEVSAVGKLLKNKTATMTGRKNGKCG